MYLTQLHIIILVVTAIESAILFYQVLYYLSRPEDESRLWYLVLLIFVMMNNICSMLFPTSQVPIPYTIQNGICFIVRFAMSLYFGYYFYKAFDMKGLRYFVNYGSMFFLAAPFLLLPILPLFVTNSPELKVGLTKIVPLLYSLGFVYSTTHALIIKSKRPKSLKTKEFHEHKWVILSAYVSLLCWAFLPVLTFFGNYDLFIQLATNACFGVMTFFYIRGAVLKYKREFKQALTDKDNLQLAKDNLEVIVKERTKEIENLYEKRALTFINLAHETRTPLTLINYHVDHIIEKQGMTPDMQVLKNNVQRLTTDITDFFDSERYDKGFDAYDHNQVSDFSELLKNKISLFRNWALRKKIKITDSIGNKILVKAHPGAIDRIINNLIENAVKYSSESKEVSVSLFANKGHVYFIVANCGAVIPAHLHEEIFEPYFQIESKKKTNGIGLGLSIVRKIVESIKGQIALESNDETKFMVTLPLWEGEIQECAVVNSTDSNVSLPVDLTIQDIQDITRHYGKPHILLVEDNLSMISFLSEKLSVKYNVYVATTGEMALAKLEAIKELDLIISDVMMGGMDGFELYKSILEDENYGYIPFIFLTAKTNSADRLTGLDLGAIDYIEKPFEMPELISKINSILELHRKQRESIEASFKSSTKNHPTGPQFIANCKRYKLSNREIDIVKLVIAEKTQKQIAEILFIAPRTVNGHKNHIFKKVGAKKAPGLIMKLCF